MPKNQERKILAYLAVISEKYDIEAKELLYCITEAWTRQESRCRELTATCRGRTEGSATFLLTFDRNIVAQIAVPEEILKFPERAVRRVVYFIGEERRRPFRRKD